MKNRLISGAGAILSGLLILLGPQYLFRLCGPMADGGWMRCHWTGQGEIGVGLMIAALGAALLFSGSEQVRFGLSAAVLLAGILALLLPSALIGGCAAETMACRSKTFPALTVISVLTIVGFAANALYLHRAQSAKGGAR